jgi:predicted transcriptional regulator
MPPSDRRPSDQRTNKDPIASELGAAQAEIMNVIWETEGATVPEIHAAINEKRKTGAAYTTVLTFVQRRYARDLLTRDPEGRTFRYRATKSRDELIASWSDEMIDRLIDDYGQIAIARIDDRLQME